jgi:signal transduction histidine kinase
MWTLRWQRLRNKLSEMALAVPVRTKIAGIMVLPVIILGLTVNYWVVSGLSDWLSWLLTDVRVHAAMAAGSRSVLFVTGLAALASLLLTWLLMLVLTQPLLDLHRVARRIAEGDLTPRVRVWARDEIGQVARSVNLMIDQLIAGRQELERTNRQLTAINRVMAATGRELDLQEVLRAALRTTLEVMSLHSGWIFLREPDSNQYRLSVTQGLSEEVEAALQREPDALCSCQRGLLADVPERVALEHRCDRINHGRSFDHITLALEARGQRFGLMNLLCPRALELAPDDLELLTTIGAQVSEAVANAWLHARLVEKESARQALLNALVHAEEEERARLARELHDGAGQTLTSLLVRLKTLEETNPDRQSCRVNDLCEAVSETIEQMREISHRLRPAVLEELGLEVALQTMIQDMASEAGLQADCHLNLDGRRLPFEIETTLYRIAQESMTNVVRHANAQQVLVELVTLPYAVALRVEDDGRGFELEALRNSKDGYKHHLGLVSIQERVEMLDGSVKIYSSPGHGTSMQARIPVEWEAVT